MQINKFSKKVSKEQCSLKTEADKLFHWIIVSEKKDRYSKDRLLWSRMKLSKCEWCILRMTGPRSQWELTERSPGVILKRPVSQLSIRRCSTCRVHHPMHPMLVFKHVGEARCVELISAQAPMSHAVLYPFNLIWTVILNAWAGVPNTSAVLNLEAD